MGADVLNHLLSMEIFNVSLVFSDIQTQQDVFVCIGQDVTSYFWKLLVPKCTA